MKIAIQTQTRRIEKGEPRIKWWRLADEKVEQDFRERVLSSIGEVVELEELEDWWIAIVEIFRKVGEEILGKSSGKKPNKSKETWWWSPNCREAIENKKKAKKTYDRSRTDENKEILKGAKEAAKTAVAQVRAVALQEMYENLESREGQKRIFKVAKERNKASKDMTAVKQIRDGNG